ncbi:MAG TPA: NUDIX hydrolase [Gammaproteobacteria bacterium]|nr:NUDIX hydrolase [Gammaproteobacteria bacterium]
MRYCSQCGHPVVVKIPPGDNRPRHVCDACGTIHYQNPRLVAGCVIEAADGRILLCRRAIEPRRGYWTIPAGFMENGETTAQCAAREAVEEARAEVRDLTLFALINVARIDQVHLMFRGRLGEGGFGAGSESTEVALFEETDIPWDSLAFPSVEFTLRRFIADRHRGTYGVHYAEIGGPLP